MADDTRHLSERIAALEAQVAAQDAALRRVLTVLAEWAEAQPRRSWRRRA